MATEHAELLASLAVQQPVPHHVKAVFRKERLVLPRGRNKEETVQKVIQDQVLPKALGNIPSVVPEVATVPFNLRKKRKVLNEEDLTQKDPKIMPTKERSGKLEMRRPVRPIDRQKMRPWLKNLLDTGSVFGLNWMRREEGIFQISWRHASRLGWSLETDGDVFERWARHTGIFKDGDDPEPKRWKANFRCALHSLPDVKELTSPTDRKGRNASRTYRFLSPSEVQPPVKRKHRYTIQIPYTYERSSDDNTSQNAESDTPNSEEDVGESVRQAPHCDHDYAARQDEEAQTTSTTFQCHGSGYVLIKSKGAHEYEFRLTSSSGESSSSSGSQEVDSKKQSGLKKPPSTHRKMQASKKKSLGRTITQPLRKGKGNSKFTKSKSLHNAGNKLKKTVEENGEGQKRIKPSKVTLKELLSSRQGVVSNAGGKKSRPKRSENSAAKKPKKEKEDSETSSKNKPKGEKNADAPSQCHGLQACMLLLEAATQLDRMDSLTTTVSTAVALPTTTSSIVPENRLPTTSASANAVQLAEAPVKALHHLLGLSTVAPSLTSTPAMASLMTAASHASLAAPAIASAPATVLLNPSGGNKIGKLPAIKEDSILSSKVQDSVGSNHDDGEAMSAAASPAGVGLSMLKQLLRLTCPTSTTAVTRSAPSVMTSFAQASTAQTIYSGSLLGHKALEKKREGQIVSSVLEKSGKSAGRSHLPSFEVVAEYEVGSSPAETREEADEKNFPYLRVHTSKVYVKAEPQILDTTEPKTQSPLSVVVGGVVVGESHQLSMSSLAVEQPAVSTAVSTHTTQTGITAAASLASNPNLAPVSVADPSPAPQSTLPVSLACSLPQTFSVVLPKAANSSTLPVAVANSFQMRAVHNEASSLTALPSATLDISQLLALCAANGNSQIIFKPEVSVNSCDGGGVTINSSCSSPKNAVDSQVHGVPTTAVQKPSLTNDEATEGVQKLSVTSQEENQIIECGVCELKGVPSNSHTDLSDCEASEQNFRSVDVSRAYASLGTNGKEVGHDTSTKIVLVQGMIDSHVSQTK